MVCKGKQLNKEYHTLQQKVKSEVSFISCILKLIRSSATALSHSVKERHAVKLSNLNKEATYGYCLDTDKIVVNLSTSKL